jgi:hypothetical protein
MIADKIGPHHLERKAILYVRHRRTKSCTIAKAGCCNTPCETG